MSLTKTEFCAVTRFWKKKKNSAPFGIKKSWLTQLWPTVKSQKFSNYSGEVGWSAGCVSTEQTGRKYGNKPKNVNSKLFIVQSSFSYSISNMCRQLEKCFAGWFFSQIIREKFNFCFFVHDLWHYNCITLEFSFLLAMVVLFPHRWGLLIEKQAHSEKKKKWPVQIKPETAWGSEG